MFRGKHHGVHGPKLEYWQTDAFVLTISMAPALRGPVKNARE